MLRPFLICFLLFLIFGAFDFSNAQPILTCNESAVPPIVTGEGIAERTGDIVLNCSGGTPGARVTGNLSIFLTVNITNRVIGSTVTGVVFTIDNGSGPQPVNVPGIIAGPSTLIYNGVSFTLSSTGTATLRIADIRAAAIQLGLTPNTSIQAFLGFNSSLVSLTSSMFNVGTPIRGLYAGFSTSLICSARGSQLPDDPTSLAGFLASKAAFSSTRLTEGFADAFSQRSAWQSLNADTGTRFLITYSGFPSGARLFVPNVIAGSDTVTPTAAGDLVVPASGGRSAPGGAGSLLLARVQGTDANGAGGSLLYTPGAPGSGTVSFDLMSEVIVNNGVGFAVYEVMDANPTVQESAQFPTFLGLAPFSGAPVITSEDVSLAPVSTVTEATAHDPIPRFQAMPPPPDCSIIGDCGAIYYPRLFVDTTPLNFTAQSGGNFQEGYVRVNNKAGGHLVWAATVSYTNGSGWLRLDPADGIDNATIFVTALPGNLTPGTYQAVLTVDGGPQAGIDTVPITFVVTPGQSPPPPPMVKSVVNAATFVAGPAVPGSLATLLGAQLAGNKVVVGFDGLSAKVLFDSDTQINLVVPAGLGNKPSSLMTVIVDGSATVPQSVALATFSPGIFKNGILNQDGSVNGPSHPAPPESILQIFATGLSGNGAITARVNGGVIDPPDFGGAAPGIPGVQQVNVQLPAGLTGTSASVAVCGGTPGRPDQAVCSPPVEITLAQ
jgi:uncharacterized protein (TIGR03437 family)